MMTSFISSSEKKVIEDCFSPKKIKFIAVQYGYDITASFLPQEFKSFSRSVTEYVLNLIRSNQKSSSMHDKGKEEEIRKEIAILVNKNLRKICNITPQESVHYPHPFSGASGGWLKSFFSS